ncbi:S8 family serine peptidase [Wenzhouxiangella sp. XN201]|uniref:S8 family serine peptidase n=1 Tax=Wenzhouxiangella sp. XN201 TaxID=2710755 RepID=UPI0013CB576D|nr:S8 family serine peptidase [Wenzhouxiangella sp. XN201]NEZ02621.1 S8 family serine peptidase [Wenzhouxiangella sp. XN201]
MSKHQRNATGGRGRRLISFSAITLLAFSAVALAQPFEASNDGAVRSSGEVSPVERQATDGPDAVGRVGRDSQYVPLDAAGRSRYIVRFVEPSLALYEGGIEGLRATSPAARGETLLDTDSADAQAYLDFLEQRQAEHLSAIASRFGRSVSVERAFKVAINAATLRLAPEEASALVRLNGVAHVERDYLSAPLTDFGPAQINADAIWSGSATPFAGTRGEGVIVGIMDTGINFQHPSFAATDGDGYTHTNPFGSGNFVGWCDPGHENHDPAYQCNDKLIGAWDYADAITAEADGPQDNQGHGSHVASTAAGNLLLSPQLSPTYGYENPISGVAPRANIIVYDVCEELCAASSVIAAIDQAIQDGVHALNESIGIGGDTFSGSKQQAYLGALAAGVAASRSAGNSGPGAATVGPEPVWVTSTAATRHVSRAFNNQVTGLAGGDTAAPGDISGQAMSGAYGPAPIVYAAEFSNVSGPDDGQCLEEFPAGTWTNGEIVVCDRGQIARVQKGENVLAGGAGGMIFVDDGNGIIADPHVLPAIHISQADGATLKTWLETGAGHQGSITEAVVSIDTSAEDVMAAFSSRGPADVAGVIKPDLGAPGQSILAAYAATDDETEVYASISGTSMASPHATGAAALMRATFPTRTASEIRSALMGTAEYSAVRKETLADSNPFDIGGGRIDLARAAQTGIVLNETASNFASADPASGGDPTTLNLASLGQSACFQTCTWQRTLKSAATGASQWQATYIGDGDATITPGSFTLEGGTTQTLEVELDVTSGDRETWQFGYVVLSNTDGDAPDFTMPVAAFVMPSESLGQLDKTVDVDTAEPGDTVNYTLTAAPFTAGTYTLSDQLPEGVTYVADSATHGLVYDAGDRTLDWSGALTGADLRLEAADPGAYLSLAGLGVTPFTVPSNCDDGGFFVDVPTFSYLGNAYSRVIFSVNGTVEVGDASSMAASFQNEELPNPDEPNNVLAPLWSDLSLCSGGNWYAASLNSGEFIVFEWEAVPLSNFWVTEFPELASVHFTFQVWIETATGDIWFAYGDMNWGAWPFGTVAAENSTGELGESYFFDGEGTRPETDDTIDVVAQLDQQMMSYQVTVDGDPLGTMVNEVLLTNDGDVSIRAWSSFEAVDPGLIFRDRFEGAETP